MIKVEGLTKRYGPTVAIRNISFEVGKGEIVGIPRPQRRREDHDDAHPDVFSAAD